jgi:hypothetical protein
MNMSTRGAVRACAVVLAMLMLLTGCAASVAQADLAAVALRAAGSTDTQDVLDYLTAASGDFEAIDSLLGDQDLGLLEEDSSDGDDLTAESITKYLGILDSHGSAIDSQLAAIKARNTPNNPEISFFREAELLEFETAADIINECKQILIYANSLLNISTEMEQLGSTTNANDPQAAFQALSEGISSVIGKLNTQSVPSFLKDMNDSLISQLNELNDAILYAAQATSITDPVRLSAAEYRMSITMRKVTEISNTSQQDFNERMTKLKADLLAIKTENEGLKSWVQQNITKLGSH